MLFFTLSGADVDFLDWKLRWRTYTTKEALITNRRIELVSKKEFAVAALDFEHETYLVHIWSISFIVLLSSSLLELDVYPFCRPQIFGLIAKEAPIKVLAKYLDFADVFSADLTSKLLKHNGINKHTIKLVDS